MTELEFKELYSSTIENDQEVDNKVDAFFDKLVNEDFLDNTGKWRSTVISNHIHSMIADIRLADFKTITKELKL